MSEFIKIAGDTPAVFFFCDHASAHIPDGLDNLGLSDDERLRHIGWDIGAAKVTRALCAMTGGAGLLAGVSRLVIDLNRDPDQAGLIPAVTDSTVVPGNQGLSPDAVAARKAKYFDPYHAELARQLDAHPHALVVSVHSFTPHPRGGEARTLDLGLLAKRDADGGDWGSAKAFLAALSETGLEAWNCAINAPYSAYDLNYTIDAHVIPRGLRHLAIEVRQDHISQDEDARTVATQIGRAIQTLISVGDDHAH